MGSRSRPPRLPHSALSPELTITAPRNLRPLCRGTRREGVHMIEQFFRESSVAQHHRKAPVVGPYLDGVVQQLVEGGYGCRTVRRYIYACEDFGRFLADRRLGLCDVDEVQVETFLNEVAKRPRTWC